MSWNKLGLSLSLLAGLMLVTPALAQQQQQQQLQQQQQQQQQDFQPQLRRANDLIGMRVQNPQGEDLGTIKDIVFDHQHDRISYAVITFGGMLGLGDKYFAVPWEALRLTSTGDNLVLNVKKSDFEAAEGFDKRQWPDVGNPRWAQGMDEFAARPQQQDQFRTQQQRQQQQQQQQRDPQMRQQPRAQQPQQQQRMDDSARTNGAYGQPISPDRVRLQARRASEITGMNVRNYQGDRLGSIEDIVIDMREGRPVFAILSWGGFIGIGGNEAAVPWASVEVLPDGSRAQLDTTSSTLEQLAFEHRRAPDLADPVVAQRIYDTFDEQPYWEVYGYVQPGTVDVQRETTAWQSYTKQYRPDDTTTISGTVESIGTFRTEDGISDGLRLRIRTEDDSLATVFVGPRWHAEQQEFFFNRGDKVEVKGSRTTIDQQSVLMASEIKHDDRTLRLLDEQGKPQWRMETRQDQMRMQQQQPRTQQPQQQPRY